MWRVLVVEDDSLQADWLCDLLEGEGMEPVGPAPGAKAALELLDTMPVDAGILDIRLQDRLCFDVARMLGERGVPFLFLTGSVGDVLPKEFQDVPLLRKPAEPSVLIDLLRSLLVRGHPG